MKLQRLLVTIGVNVIIFTASLHSSEFIVKDINSQAKHDGTWVALPYIFSSDSMGITTGVLALLNGYIQPQMSVVASAFIGENMQVQNNVNTVTHITKENARASGIFLAVTGFKPCFSKRMFLSVMGLHAYYPNQRLYLDGSNDSLRDIESKDPAKTTPLQTQGYNSWADINFRFVLPLGEGKESITPVIKLSRGLPVNRQNVGNGMPFVTGQTILSVKGFYNGLTADKFSQHPSINTNGMRLALSHNNTDYPDNPSRGYSMQVQYSEDFGWGESSESWNAVDASYAHYLELPNFTWTRQNVVALNVWSAYSPSWDNSKKGANGLAKNRPPMWEGARLGGYDRMRAYDMNRFSDKAALYGSVEYRVIPEFNPMHEQHWSPVAIDWFQAVMFAEAGRVAPHYNLELLEDMKYDLGLSLRILAARMPVRFEMAYGSEGSNMWIMIKQPF